MSLWPPCPLFQLGTTSSITIFRYSCPLLRSKILFWCFPLGWSGSGSVIQDHSDHDASKEPMNPLWTRILRFQLSAFLWDDPDQDQWSKITRIMVHQRNRWIHSGQGSFCSFDAPWSGCSWINDPDLDHPNGTHPLDSERRKAAQTTRTERCMVPRRTPSWNDFDHRSRNLYKETVHNIDSILTSSKLYLAALIITAS